MIHPLAPIRERFDAVLFDLDGTLLDRKARVTARTHRAVRTLVAAGFKVHVCTGRSVAGCLSVYRGLGLDTALAAYNGNWIGIPGRRPWWQRAIDDASVVRIERTEARAFFSFRHAEHRKYTVPVGHRHFSRVAAWYENVVPVRAASDLPRKDLMRVSCFFGDPEEVRAGWEAIDETTRDRLLLQEYPLGVFPEFADTGLHLGEIQPKTRGKAELIHWLAEERGIPAERTIAVGDQRNDLTLLEAAGLSVVVVNAVPEARALADRVIGDHDEDGIARWVEAGMPLEGGES